MSMSALLNTKVLVKDCITEARQCEESGCVIHAADIYEDVLEHLNEIMCFENIPAKVKTYQRQLFKITNRLKELKEQFNYHNTHGRLQNHIYIKEGSQNVGYKKIFGKYLTPGVREVLIYNPQFNRRNHIKNLLHFIELLVRYCPNLSYIRLNTITCRKTCDYQTNILKNIQLSLADKNITFSYRFMDQLAEHMIILSNGYIFKSPHGLNYFRDHISPYTLGICDYDFRSTIKTHFVLWRTSPYIQEIPNSTFRYMRCKPLCPDERYK